MVSVAYTFVYYSRESLICTSQRCFGPIWGWFNQLASCEAGQNMWDYCKLYFPSSTDITTRNQWPSRLIPCYMFLGRRVIPFLKGRCANVIHRGCLSPIPDNCVCQGTKGDDQPGFEEIGQQWNINICYHVLISYKIHRSGPYSHFIFIHI